jgi:hypothetical protein
MKLALAAALAAVALLGASTDALAQGTPSSADAPRPPPARPDSTAATRLDRPVRVRASHRVDVIGPGERVETIIDRMRSTRPVTPPGDVKSVERPAPPRPPERDRARERDENRAEGQRGQGGGPHAGPGNQGPGSDRSRR